MVVLPPTTSVAGQSVYLLQSPEEGAQQALPAPVLSARGNVEIPAESCPDTYGLASSEAEALCVVARREGKSGRWAREVTVPIMMHKHADEAFLKKSSSHPQCMRIR